MNECQNRSKGDPAFTTTGFSNWEKAKERFSNHVTSSGHADSVSMWRDCQFPDYSIRKVNDCIEHSLHEERV